MGGAGLGALGKGPKMEFIREIYQVGLWYLLQFMINEECYLIVLRKFCFSKTFVTDYIFDQDFWINIMCFSV